jgi:uncharacterized OB-fold protein
MSEELIFVPGKWEIPYHYAAGKTSSRFFIELRDNKKLLGIKCSKCGRVMMPPRGFCERCFVKADEWVEVGPHGTIEAFTITMEKWAGNPDPPFAVAYVKLDGADSAMLNYVTGLKFSDLEETAKSLKIGTRVKAIFKEKRSGKVTDFEYALLS